MKKLLVLAGITKEKETLKYHHIYTRWQYSPMLYLLSGLHFLVLFLQNFKLKFRVKSLGFRTLPFLMVRSLEHFVYICNINTVKMNLLLKVSIFYFNKAIKISF